MKHVVFTKRPQRPQNKQKCRPEADRNFKGVCESSMNLSMYICKLSFLTHTVKPLMRHDASHLHKANSKNKYSCKP